MTLIAWPLRIATFELVGLLTFGRLLARPLRRRHDGEEFPYGADLQLPLIAILLVCVMETPPTALLLNIFLPVAGIRWLILVAELYLIWWVAVVAASVITEPHRIRHGRLELHAGAIGAAKIPLELIKDVKLVAANFDRGRFLGPSLSEACVAFPVQQKTSLEIHLADPVLVSRLLGAPLPALTIRFHANDPRAMAAAVQRAAAAWSVKTSR